MGRLAGGKLSWTLAKQALPYRKVTTTATENKQVEQLPVTTSSSITESKGTFMGLDGMSFFVVMMAGVLLTIFFNFFAGLGTAILVYIIMRLYISNRPDGFLMDVIIYAMRPKLFEHRPRGRYPVLLKNE